MTSTASTGPTGTDLRLGGPTDGIPGHPEPRS